MKKDHAEWRANKPKEVKEAEKKALKRFDQCVSADSFDRANALDDFRNYAGQQWDSRDLEERRQNRRPALTINRLVQPVQQVVAEIRAGKISPTALPVDSVADPEKAKVVEGLLKDIAYQSKMEVCYEQAGENAARCGRGAFRVVTEYESADTFNQVVRVRPIEDPFCVYWDPAAKEYDKSDAKFCFVTEWMEKEEFKDTYGDDATEFDGAALGDNSVWSLDGQCRHAEYWEKHCEEEELWLLEDENGETVTVKASESPAKKDLEANGIRILRKRTVKKVTLKRWILGGAGFLCPAEEFPGEYIPIIPVFGPTLLLDGKRQHWSVIRHAKDPQAMYNFWTSAITEAAALAPKAPYMVTPKQIQGVESLWQMANRTNLPYLVYNPDTNAPGPPARSGGVDVQPAMIQQVMQAGDDIKAVTGIHDASLGMPGNETSGLAIQSRQSEGDSATFVWIDNLHRSVEHAYRVIAGLIPTIYDTPRTVRIVGEKEAEQWVAINQPNAVTGSVDNALDGKYDVRLVVGPATKTQRQQRAQVLSQLIQAAPQFASAFADLLVESLDFDRSAEVAERIRKLSEPQPPSPEKVLEMKTKEETLKGKELVNWQRQDEINHHMGGQDEPEGFVNPA